MYAFILQCTRVCEAVKRWTKACRSTENLKRRKRPFTASPRGV